MNDHKQEIIMKIEQLLSWKEPRITMNDSHPFWSTRNPIMEIQGQFVEDCLWTPRMHYVSVDKMFIYNPTPTASIGTPIHIYLNHTGKFISWLKNSKLSLSCSMDFTRYPFDRQVKYVIMTNK